MARKVATIVLILSTWKQQDDTKSTQREHSLQRKKMWAKNMKPLGEIEEELATKAEPVLGFKPSSKFKRGPIGILIYVLCGIVAFISMRSAGVF